MRNYEAPSFELVGALRDITLEKNWGGFGGGWGDNEGGHGHGHDRGHSYSA